MDRKADHFPENDSLFREAAAAAQQLEPVGIGGGRRSAARLRRDAAEIRRRCETLRRLYADAPSPPAAAAWLLDNWYLAKRACLEAAPALRSARRLRLCGEGPMILALARSLLRCTAGQVTEAGCGRFLAGFQTIRILWRSELALFPVCLRAAALEEIAAVCREPGPAADSEQAAQRLEALFGTLRLLSQLDVEPMLSAADVCAEILSADPDGTFPRMDRESRQEYLRRLEKQARRAGMEESSYARRLVQAAAAEDQHVGSYLFSEPLPLFSWLYIAANLLLTAALSLRAGLTLRCPAAALLLLLPVSELVKCLLDFLLLHLLRPRRLPRLDLSAGVPDEGRTICVVSVLLTDPEEARRAAARLEELRLCCRTEGRNLLFGLLADLPEAEAEETEADRALLEAAREEVRRLNRRCAGGFFLFTRKRRFDGERWAPPERKRGALLALAALLCGRESELEICGERDSLAGTRFILTLDSDTRIYPGAAGELIGAMLHPLVHPHLDEARGVVDRGHAILHPRLDTDLPSVSATDFSLICAGVGGSDPYGGLCGELSMDAFDSGGFAGKGLIDARSLLLCSEAHIPAGRILSHDAPEGALLRGGFVGDAAFSDRFPARPLAYYKRLHRWVRGDWQNLSFLFCRELAAIDRWRLFDSLRRSLLAPMTLLAVLAGFLLPGHPLAVSAWAALSALLSRLLLALAEEGLRRREGPRLRRFTRILSGVGGAILQSFLRLWLLPYEAWVCLSAALTALWRMGVSHRRLLQWQTAAQSERNASSLASHLAAMGQSLLLGAGLLLLSPLIIGRSAGLLWLLSPLAAWALSLPAYQEAALAGEDREYLRGAAEKGLRYFTECCTAEDAFLPPDNFQEEPPLGLAHRSSPTNIGLALVSFVAACDLELLERREALRAIRRILDTLERLPRCRGHFYNWYDTRTLRPLSPAMVSTVDSGNLCACLIVLDRALREFGEEALAARAEALADAMDFAPLYDAGRGLFYICFDPESERGLGGWYDLMASEAMLTSYLAIARGDVPRRHWRRLSRAQLQKDGFRGLASWTGTMFEYLMSALFLPLCRGSLLFESARFCLYAQKRQRFAGKPWGISESAFYSLDPAMSYRYKASGCAALALKRGQEADMVIAPYASFLALAVDSRAALRNLRLLERFGAVGRYGFLEALDFTPARCRREDGEKVRCYMAHHIGMSILAAANTLCGGSIRRRFFSDPAMAACRLLLEERVPEAGPVLRRELSRAQERPARGRQEGWLLRGGAGDAGGASCLLSNGVYHLRADSRGAVAARWGELSVYDELLFTVEEVGTLQSWTLSEDQCLWEYRRPGTEALFSLCAAAEAAGERRELHLRCDRDRELTLRLSFAPMLAEAADWESHPAFWRLGIESESRENELLLHRLTRGDHRGFWLCLRCDRPMRFSFRESRVTAEAALALRGGELFSLRLALCLAAGAEEARSAAREILRSGERGGMVSAAALHLRMTAGELGAAMALLPALRRPLADAAPRRLLWPFGISGDLPLLCCPEGAKEALPLLRRFLLLRCCGLRCDLCFLTEEQGEYRRPFQAAVEQELRALGLEALLGSRGGVHFAPRGGAEALMSRAAWAPGRAAAERQTLRFPALSRPRAPGGMPEASREDGAFLFTVRDSLPPRAWQLVLGHGGLGAILTECGPAALWQANAREMRLLPPVTDLRAVSCAAPLWAELPEGPLSLFAANDGAACRVHFEPGAAVYEKRIGGRQIRTTVFLADEALVLLIEGADGLPLHWAMRPTLGPDASSLQAGQRDGAFRAQNPESDLPDLVFTALWSGQGLLRTDYAPPAMHLSFPGQAKNVLVCGCGGGDALRRLCAPGAAEAALAGERAYWRGLAARLRFSCGEPAVDRYLNDWAVYQTLCCRLLARSSLYQSGGAFGFRDQLQDAVNLLPLDPDLARARILDCCRHQYAEGDVMHWWHPHPQGDRGLRSRCGDDLLWLPWALCEYVEHTKDTILCGEPCGWLVSPPLETAERSRYETPARSDSVSTVLIHARAALDRCLARPLGAHGLPLFGSGDWNDGLDAVDGESVWLGFFLAHVAARFAALLERLCQPGAPRYRVCAEQLLAASEAGWNGRFYRRGYWADGSTLGGEERIDLLVQAWAALCGAERADEALDAAMERLVDREHSLVLLFAPPYTEAERSPGYLTSYGAGFRENGGQYTHAAVWFALALARRGRREDALEILRMLLPQSHDPLRYEAEPFVLAADVCAAPGREGEAGWTWYTGSAGWFLRAGRELTRPQTEGKAL